MAIQTGIGIVDTKKKKKDMEQIMPTVSKQGQKLFDIKGQAVTPTASLPNLANLTPKPTVEQQVTPTNNVQEIPIDAQMNNPNYQSMDERLQNKAETETQPTTEPVDYGTQIQDTNARLAEISRQKRISALKDAYNTALASEQRNLAELPSMFREKQSQVQTQDVMARRNAENVAALGATGTGSLAQSNIAQNVITQGQIGALNQQELQAKQDIKNRIAELDRALASGIADVNADIEMAQLQQNLDALTVKEQAALKQAEIKDQRDWDLYIRELDKLDDREKAIFENDLKQENTILDAKIQEARDNRNYQLESQLISQRSANDIKLEGIRAANDMAQIQARGAEDRATAQFRSDLEPIATEQAGAKYDDKTIDASIANAVARAKSQAISTDQFGRTVGTYTPTDEANTITQWIAQNADDLSEAQGNALVRRYNLDINEIRRMME